MGQLEQFLGSSLRRLACRAERRSQLAELVIFQQPQLEMACRGRPQGPAGGRRRLVAVAALLGAGALLLAGRASQSLGLFVLQRARGEAYPE
mmetsp:Transcript_95973/g.286477  ORF Transcript_95973/g.286477 Transcript_95973/m.286477 type:complete len:92 (-) Transcript_95973:906-1181(-)